MVRFNYWRIAIAALLIGQQSLNDVWAQNKAEESRRITWQQYLDSRPFLFPENYIALIWSLREFKGNSKVHIVFDPKDIWHIEYKFVRDNREILSIEGHDKSAYAADGNDLYFAKYTIDSAGCTIVAYDLATGKEKWQTELHQAQPAGHSGYGNLVFIRLSRKNEAKGDPEGSAIIVSGMESYCDYIEVLDRKTGESLAIKNYRVGFAPPAGGGGFFGGETKAKKLDAGKGGKR